MRERGVARGGGRVWEEECLGRRFVGDVCVSPTHEDDDASVFSSEDTEPCSEGETNDETRGKMGRGASTTLF